MPFRSIASAMLLALTLAACDASSSSSCSSKEAVTQMVSALSDDLQKAEGSGKLDRAKTADAMGRMLSAGQTFAANQDRLAYCAALGKIRQESGL